MDAWTHSAEQIAISQTIQGRRVLGITSPTRESSVSTLARMIAEAMGRSRFRALLVLLNVGENSVPTVRDPSEPWHAVTRDADDSIDILTANVTPETRHIFNNSEWLQAFFAEKLRTYSNLVLDLPAIVDEESNRLNPLVPASVCDSVILVCATGAVTRAELDQSLKLLKSAEANVIGLVVNEEGYVSRAEEFGLTKARISKFMTHYKKSGRRQAP